MARKPRAKTSATGAVDIGRLDMASFETLEKFRLAAAAYTLKAVKSKESAIKTLQREGFLTKSGKLAKRYSAG